MEWKFDDQKPIYVQISEELLLRIIAGTYQPGSRFPSVRELAAEASVNPNTMQKALAELEGSGLIYAVRTSGRFVTENENEIAEARRRLAEKRVSEFLAQMNSLGVGREEILRLIQDGGFFCSDKNGD